MSEGTVEVLITCPRLSPQEPTRTIFTAFTLTIGVYATATRFQTPNIGRRDSGGTFFATSGFWHPTRTSVLSIKGLHAKHGIYTVWTLPTRSSFQGEIIHFDHFLRGLTLRCISTLDIG
ncbi:hypothetical protein BDZ89DRAFT_1085414 [Hymenopellis radicata]|nr:hypothetical protein BDZ89DRAFT_1085414 [Hymenopellis radicata]